MPPLGWEELSSLDLRIPGIPDGGALWADLRTASAAVREMNGRLL